MRYGCDIVSQIVSDLLLSGGIVVVMLRSKNISHRTKYKKWVITGEPPNYTNLDRTCDIFLYQPRCSSSRFSLGLTGFALGKGTGMYTHGYGYRFFYLFII